VLPARILKNQHPGIALVISHFARIPLTAGSQIRVVARPVSDNPIYRELSKQYSASRLAYFTYPSLKLRIYFPAFVKLFSRHPKWKCRMLLESPFIVVS